MKNKKVEHFWDKISLTGCKWSNLNAPRSETPVSHSLLGDSLFPIFSPCCFLSSSLWGNKELSLPLWKVKSWKFFGTKWAQQAANGPVSLTPSTETPVFHSLLGDYLFLIFCLCCFLASSLWVNKKLDLPVWKVKSWKIKWSNLNAPRSETPVSFISFNCDCKVGIRFQIRKVARKHVRSCDGLHIWFGRWALILSRVTRPCHFSKFRLPSVYTQLSP